jgi:hypothetical protein
MGMVVPGLSAELQPVANYLVPHIVSKVRDPTDTNLQLLRDIARRLSPIAGQLGTELLCQTSEIEPTITFFAMLVGPFYPILAASARSWGHVRSEEASEPEDAKGQSGGAPLLSISANFMPIPTPRKHKDDTLENNFPMREVLGLLRVARDQPQLYEIAVAVAKTLHSVERLSRSAATAPLLSVEMDALRADARTQIGTEGLLLLLQACTANLDLCSVFQDPTATNFLALLPLLRVLVPAMRNHVSLRDQQGMCVEHAVCQYPPHWLLCALACAAYEELSSKLVSLLALLGTSRHLAPLLQACAPYLCSKDPLQERAATVLLDLAAAPLIDFVPELVQQARLLLSFAHV